jgi:hypothetical protein
MIQAMVTMFRAASVAAYASATDGPTGRDSRPMIAPIVNQSEIDQHLDPREFPRLPESFPNRVAHTGRAATCQAAFALVQ